jgi:hypothetical protein
MKECGTPLLLRGCRSHEDADSMLGERKFYGQAGGRTASLAMPALTLLPIGGGLRLSRP